MHVEERTAGAPNTASGTEPFVRTPNAVLREIAGEHLLVPIRRGNLMDAESLYLLDEVGVWLWAALASPRTLHELVEGVCDAFEGTETRNVEADVHEWLQDMRGQGLVKAGGDA